MSSIGRIYKVTTYGESHGLTIGAIVENFPSNFKIDKKFIQHQLNRRKPGQSILINTNRKEEDIVEIHSGIENDVSLGTPILLLIKNKDQRPQDYAENCINKKIDKNCALKSLINLTPRPGHADLVYLNKYGIKSSSGGGRSSARETAARVAAGALAETFLKHKYNINIFSFVRSVGNIELNKIYLTNLNKNISLNLNRDNVDYLGSFNIFFLDNQSIYIEKLFYNKFELIFLLNVYLNKLYFVVKNVHNIEDVKIKELDIDDFKKNNYFKLDINNTKLNIVCLNFKYTEFEKSKDINSIIAINISVNSETLDNVCSLEFVLLENINIRSIDPITSIKMILNIIQTKKEKDSLGGILTCVIENIPKTLGEPCFDKLEAELAKAMLSIPSTKGFEIGSGFEGTKLKGSNHNDMNYYNCNNKINNNELCEYKSSLKSSTNYAGGVLGGISSGETLYFNVAFKPVSTIGIPQLTCNYNNETNLLENKGRHDPCVVNRAVPIVESMSAIVILDLVLLQNSRLFCN